MVAKPRWTRILVMGQHGAIIPILGADYCMFSYQERLETSRLESGQLLAIPNHRYLQSEYH